MNTGKLYYTGTIVEIIDPVLYEIRVDIPGVIQSVKAFPMRTEIDQPRVGDLVLLKCLDPIFQSYYIYQKLKENDFIGFRSNGKMIDITPDYIKIATFDPELEYSDKEGDTIRPKTDDWDWIKLDKEGNLEVNLRKNATITIKGEAKIEVEGKINLEGDSITIESPDAKIIGGKLTVNGSVTPTGSGPFCGIPTCPFTGAPHTGNTVNGT